MHTRSGTQPRLLSRCSAGLLMLALFAVSVLFALTAYADGSGGAHFVTVQMHDRRGNFVGTVKIRQLTSGTVFATHLQGLPPGKHAFQIRYSAQCGALDAAMEVGRGELSRKHHGLDREPGFYAGDVSNIQVTAQGTATAKIFAPQWALGAASAAQRNAAAATGWKQGPFPLLDADGSAIIIYKQLAQGEAPGDAGPRIACGVIRQ